MRAITIYVVAIDEVGRSLVDLNPSIQQSVIDQIPSNT